MGLEKSKGECFTLRREAALSAPPPTILGSQSSFCVRVDGAKGLPEYKSRQTDQIKEFLVLEEVRKSSPVMQSEQPKDTLSIFALDRLDTRRSFTVFYRWRVFFPAYFMFKGGITYWGSLSGALVWFLGFTWRDTVSTVWWMFSSSSAYSFTLRSPFSLPLFLRILVKHSNELYGRWKYERSTFMTNLKYQHTNLHGRTCTRAHFF